jgi:glycosyltransferase involved in cell wall biosynthesis
VVGMGPPAEPGVLALGTVDELTKARVLRASDVFLFPARYEGFGLAPREAMRYGVATVVSRHVPLEGVEPRTAVRIVPTDDPADYASELAELFADPRLRRSVGEAGRLYADRFSYARMADQFERWVAPLLP